MTRGGNGPVLKELDRLFRRGTAAALSTGQLLERFVSQQDQDAFAALVDRLGPMVLGVCRRMLNDPCDVDDAFQATFLILVRKAGEIRDRERLSPWLYGVAQRVAARARSQSRLRRLRECSDENAVLLAKAPHQNLEQHALRWALDEEVRHLPEKYRFPIVLCYLEGLTHEEAARHLRCPVGTVHTRMAWARTRLRSRLDRRGLALPGGHLGLALTVEIVPTAVSYTHLDVYKRQEPYIREWPGLGLGSEAAWIDAAWLCLVVTLALPSPWRSSPRPSSSQRSP